MKYHTKNIDGEAEARQICLRLIASRVPFVLEPFLGYYEITVAIENKDHLNTAAKIQLPKPKPKSMTDSMYDLFV